MKAQLSALLIASITLAIAGAAPATECSSVLDAVDTTLMSRALLRARADIETYKLTANGTTHALADLSFCQVWELREEQAGRAMSTASIDAQMDGLRRQRSAARLPSANCRSDVAAAQFERVVKVRQ